MERLKGLNPLSEAFIESAVEAGYPRNDDFNGLTIEGFGRHHLTMTGGERLTSARAFQHRAPKRSNREVSNDTLVERLIIEGGQWASPPSAGRSRASREIILCGGKFNSPQLLMLSGIGDPDDLQPFGIPVLHELPGVGKNYQDHA